MADSALTGDVDRLVERVAELARLHGCSIAVAESLTGGQLAAALASGPEAGEWFRGGIVAYHPEVKYDLLDAPRGPVVTPETAAAMAGSARERLGADCAAALTGVGGPGPEEGKPPGTVYLAVAGGREDAGGGDAGAGATAVEGFRFDGDPIEVIAQSIEAALAALIRRLGSSV